MLASALLFWGWQTRMLGVAILMAVIVEVPHWVKWRVEFSLPDFNRIWDLCSVLTVMAGLYCVINRGTTNELMILFQATNFTEKNAAVQELSGVAMIFFQWWPMLLFLMVLAQAFGSREVVPYTTYSILARRSLRRQGKPQADNPGVNFSFPYFAVCLYSASLTARSPDLFFWCFTGLCLWGFWIVRPRRFSPVFWIVIMAVFVGTGFVAQRQLPQMAADLEGRLAGWVIDYLRGGSQGHEFDTEIGDLAESKAKGSGKIVMRVTAAGAPPELLRNVVYTRFTGRGWDNAKAISYTELESVPGAEVWHFRDTPAVQEEVTIATMLGAHPTVIPRPSGTFQIDDLPVAELTTNVLGSVRGFGGPPFVVYKVAYGGDETIDSPPEWIDPKDGRKGVEFSLSTDEGGALETVSREIGLDYGQDPREMAVKITRFFEENFEYQTSTPTRSPIGATNQFLIPYFLLENRRGHCELFASATVLLMRLNGVGARYTLGWSVQEQGDGEGEYVVRMRHAHAWCRYWSIKENRWLDLDTTPPGWFESESSAAAWHESMQDWWSDRMHAFRMWRYYGDTGNLQNYLLAALAVLVVILSWRLLFRRRRRASADAGGEFWNFAKLGLDSEFYEIENRIRRLGLVRHDGESLLDWLRRLEGREEVRPHLLREIIQLHYRYRFDPRGLSDGDRDQLRSVVNRWLAPLEAVTAPA
jgi:protein-glutamine gamma-glutamyltransferase